MNGLAAFALAALLLFAAGVLLTRASKDPQAAQVGTIATDVGVLSLVAHAILFLLVWTGI
jgi:hypothetical protein